VTPGKEKVLTFPGCWWQWTWCILSWSSCWKFYTLHSYHWRNTEVTWPIIVQCERLFRVERN